MARPPSKVFSLPDDAEQPAQFAYESQEPKADDAADSCLTKAEIGRSA